MIISLQKKKKLREAYGPRAKARSVTGPMHVRSRETMIFISNPYLIKLSF